MHSPSTKVIQLFQNIFSVLCSLDSGEDLSPRHSTTEWGSLVSRLWSLSAGPGQTSLELTDSSPGSPPVFSWSNLIQTQSQTRTRHRETTCIIENREWTMVVKWNTFLKKWRFWAEKSFIDQSLSSSANTRYYRVPMAWVLCHIVLYAKYTVYLDLIRARLCLRQEFFLL